MKNNMNILSRFPKERIELPQAYQDIYTQHYLSNREGEYKTTSLSMKLERWLHKKVAQDVIGSGGGRGNNKTLEIGAGTLNQLQYEPAISNYDIVEPFEELYKDSELLSRVKNIYSDISEITEKYDRITSIAVFEHIMDLPCVVAKAAMHLNEGGCIRTSIPNEGTIMWKMGTRVTGYEFKKKYDLDYNVLMRFEHVNTAQDIEDVLDHFFTKTESASFGLSKRLAFYRFFEHRNPKVEAAKAYLESRKV